MSERLEVRTELARLLDAARVGVTRAQRRGRQLAEDDRPDPLDGLWSGALALLDGIRTLLPAPADTSDTGAAAPADPSATPPADAPAAPPERRGNRPERIDIS